MNALTVEDMRRHVEELAARHDILVETRWTKDVCDSYAIRECDDGARDEIGIPPIDDAIVYAAALHEIGHILGRYQDRHVNKPATRERWAWRWARDNAIVWTPAMEQSVVPLGFSRGGG